MILLRGVGWTLLVLAGAALVNDCLEWRSQGTFEFQPIGDLWARLNFASLHYLEVLFESHISTKIWLYGVMPPLGLPALPAFLAGGVLFLRWGRRIGSRAEARFTEGPSTPRRRRADGA